ncbi:MAG: ROK family protein [Candidatus Omnitrophota bacterium]
MKKVAIGIDIGGTNVKLGLVSPSGHVIARDTFPTKGPGGKAAFLRALKERTDRLVREARRIHLKVTGVGVGAPGPIDVERGFVYFFPNIPGWKNTPLKSLLEQRFGLPVNVDNDANVMALAEFCFGAGRGAKNLIALTLGTGVGGGLIIGGRLFHGPRYSAAEIGHLVINEDGPRCACGSRGCVETYVGNGYFVREIKRRLRKGEKSVLRKWSKEEGLELTPLLAAQAAKRGDAFSKKMWKEAGERLGTALAGLVNILNPERIILGGGIAQSGLLFGPVKATLRKKAFPIAARSVRVMPAKLGVDAGLIGAAALIFMQEDR